MRENAIRENVQSKFIQVKHIAGLLNPSDLFTKEIKNVEHFFNIRDQLVCLPPVQSLVHLKTSGPRGVLST